MQSDTLGWLGGVGAGFTLTKNVDEIFMLDMNAHIQYKAKRNLYLLLGNYGFLKGGDTKLIDNTFFHFRFNRKLSNLLRWELFTQLQKNVITKIDSRFLAGTGPRFKIVSTPIIKLYAATLVMFESEKEQTSPRIVHHDVRSSSYISFTITPTDRLEIVSTTFYQPRLNKVADYRLLNQASLQVKATKKLSMNVSWNYLFDRFPVEGVPRTNYTLSTGFRFDF